MRKVHYFSILFPSETNFLCFVFDAAGDLLRMVAGRGGYRMRDEEMLSAVVLRNRVHEAASSREVVWL